jgi:hypothetical protein
MASTDPIERSKEWARKRYPQAEVSTRSIRGQANAGSATRTTQRPGWRLEPRQTPKGGYPDRGRDRASDAHRRGPQRGLEDPSHEVQHDKYQDDDDEDGDDGHGAPSLPLRLSDPL